ncbi:hypothetical protein [Krasilnikovia sp. M28-CT-15]|uniref:hypothetical protein n=1 Tax=Krasilnikovia sp. M28-CT-15 TaxID=3373540 RepID=UPI003877362C
MTASDPHETIAAATRAAAQLRELVLREAPRGVRLAWAEQLRQVVDILTTDDDPAEVLKYAMLTFDRLYSGGRNFSDFHVERPDRAAMVAENEQLAALTGELHGLLHST